MQLGVDSVIDSQYRPMGSGRMCRWTCSGQALCQALPPGSSKYGYVWFQNVQKMSNNTKERWLTNQWVTVGCHLVPP